MKLPFKPHLLVLLCSAGLFAASGVMFVKSRTTEPAPVTQQPSVPAPAPVAAPTPVDQPAPAAIPTYTAAQIDQWVAPIALYPDSLLSQILMASTYPANVIQAAQWSKDNPKMQGDAAIQAVASQPWDPSVKSLVAFPQLMSLMGEIRRGYRAWEMLSLHNQKMLWIPCNACVRWRNRPGRYNRHRSRQSPP